MLQAVLLVILIFVCVAMILVILLQKSEGGALGMGGGPSGFMSTRGVGDLLTRTTGILAGAFFVLCLGLTLLIGRAHRGDAVVDRLKLQGLDPAAIAAQRSAAAARQAAASAPAQPTVDPTAPILEAPKPEVHSPSSAQPLLSPATPPATAPANTTAPTAR